MNEAQKKAIYRILIFLLIIFSIFSIAIYVVGHLEDNEVLKIIGFVSTILSPSTLFGIVIKFIINKNHIKRIDNKLNDVGLNLRYQEEQEIEKEYKDTNTKFLRVKNYVFVEKEDKIIIKFNNEGLTNLEIEENFKYAFKEFLEWKRKQKNSLL